MAASASLMQSYHPVTSELVITLIVSAPGRAEVCQRVPHTASWPQIRATLRALGWKPGSWMSPVLDNHRLTAELALA